MLRDRIIINTKENEGCLAGLAKKQGQLVHNELERGHVVI